MNSNKCVYYVFTQHMEERAGVAVEKVAGKSTEKAAKAGIPDGNEVK